MKRHYFYTVLLALVGMHLPATAQQIADETLAQYNKNIASVHNSHNQSGTAFVIGADKGLLYLLTAAHVVAKDEKVDIAFTDAKLNGRADVKINNAYYDFAVLALPNKGWTEPFLPCVTNAMVGDNVFAISLRINRKTLPFNKEAQVLEIDQADVNCDVGIDEGDSGTPLLCNAGLVGMLCRYPGKGRSALLLKQMVQEAGMPWQLPDVIINRQLTADALPDASNEENLTIQFFWDEEAMEHAPALADQNPESGYTFSTAGWHRLTIQMPDDRTFNKIRILCPYGKYVDFNSGYIFLPGSKKKFNFTSYKLPVMERSSMGNWIIYDLRRYYHEDRVTLVFKVDKDTKDKPDPVTLYEIQIRGPKQ